MLTELSPPYQITLNNQITGSSTELVKAILTKAQINHEIAMVPWARALHLATNKPNTLIFSIAKTQEREAHFEWIGPVATFELGFVSLKHRNDLDFNDFNKAKNYTVVVQRNDIAQQVLTSLGFDVIETRDIHHSYNLLLNNKVDLLVDDRLFLPDMARQLNLPDDQFKFITAIPALAINGYLAANRHMDQAQLDAIKKAYMDLVDSDVYRAALINNGKE
ncbi:hypothetical protein PALB_770 [Pseudoalteromonas luteoviolacea B = ATCC 29581]|nr:hypothetical protein PALB_770 [Pseudoalteromonas luteoviolacea B = ATCC 29581]